MIPSVSQILRYGGFLRDAGIRDRYKEKGKFIHKKISGFISGFCQCPNSTVIESGFILSFQRFIEYANFISKGQNQIFINQKYGYRGIPDLWGICHGVPTLIEVKTGCIEAFHSIQCSAYYELLLSVRYHVEAAISLYLKEDGFFDFRYFNSFRLKGEFQKFLDALNDYKNRTY